MFNVGGGEVLVILFIALIVLGPDKLPEFSRKVGQVVSEVRRFAGGFQDEMRRAMEPEPEKASSAAPVPEVPKPDAVTSLDPEGAKVATDDGPTEAGEDTSGSSAA